MASDPLTAALRSLARPATAASVAALFPGKPRLLALGEPAHGVAALLDARNALVREFVEEHGCRTVALETDCLRAAAVDAHVTTGAGSLDSVLADGFSHGWGAFPGNRELLRWMRGHNAGRPAAERVRFAGIDGPLEITAAASPREPLTALHGFLAERLDAALLPCGAETLDRLLGPDERWTDPAAMTDPARSCGRSPEAAELRLLADELAALLAERVLRGERERERARLQARTALGLLRYHHWMADGSAGRLSRLVGLRDLMMAENMLALAERPDPVLVVAHNSHLRRAEGAMELRGPTAATRGSAAWWSAGALVADRLGDGYGFVATALGTLPEHGVGAPAADTLEGVLYGVGEECFVVGARGLGAALGGRALVPRESPYYGYAPFEEGGVAGCDGVVFVRDVSRAAG